MKRLVLALTLLLAGCDNSDGPRVRDVTIWLQDPLAHLQTPLGDDVDKDCFQGTCTLNFTQPSASGNVLRVQLGGAKPFRLNGVFSLTAVGYEEDRYRIAEITLMPASPPTNSLHSEARTAFYQLLAQLGVAGWQRFIMQDSARLPGAEFNHTARIEQALPQASLNLPFNDPAVPLNLAQWRSLPLISQWYFYRDDEYLSIIVQRENSDSAPDERGTYLFMLTFKTETQQYQSYFTADDRPRWKSLLPALLKQMAQTRTENEARMRDIGVTIDEHYRDPTIGALDKPATQAE